MFKHWDCVIMQGYYLVFAPNERIIDIYSFYEAHLFTDFPTSAQFKI